MTVQGKGWVGGHKSWALNTRLRSWTLARRQECPWAGEERGKQDFCTLAHWG